MQSLTQHAAYQKMVYRLKPSCHFRCLMLPCVLRLIVGCAI